MMSQSKKTIFVGSVLLLLAGTCFAQSVNAQSVIDSDAFRNLQKKGQLHTTYYKKENVVLSYTPDLPLAKQTVKAWTGTEKPCFVVENLYLLDKKTLADKAKAAGEPVDTSLQKASQIIRSVSKMAGMKSVHDGSKVDVLYKKAYTVKSPDDEKQIPDQITGSADGLQLYAYQHDHSFGNCYYKLNYHQTENEVSAVFSNYKPIYFGPIKAIESDNIKISLDVIDCGNQFMVYMLVQAQFPALSILENNMNDSFNSRLNAIYDWFTKQF